MLWTQVGVSSCIVLVSPMLPRSMSSLYPNPLEFDAWANYCALADVVGRADNAVDETHKDLPAARVSVFRHLLVYAPSRI